MSGMGDKDASGSQQRSHLISNISGNRDMNNLHYFLPRSRGDLVVLTSAVCLVITLSSVLMNVVSLLFLRSTCFLFCSTSLLSECILWSLSQRRSIHSHVVITSIFVFRLWLAVLVFSICLPCISFFAFSWGSVYVILRFRCLVFTTFSHALRMCGCLVEFRF